MSRIDEFDSQPVTNVVQHDRAAHERWMDWMMGNLTDRNERGESSLQTAKRVLGKQDFCWTGGNRHWIWVRPFDVDLGEGRTETWRWRLFVSVRGCTLEIEDKHNRPYGESIKVAGVAGLDAFIETWKAGKGW